jgi:hypothetical protein
MADKTGIDNLLSTLERICLEHYAMRAVLREENPHGWRVPVRKVRKAQHQIDAVHSQFREVIDSQQSSAQNVLRIDLLLMALNRTTL